MEDITCKFSPFYRKERRKEGKGRDRSSERKGGGRGLRNEKRDNGTRIEILHYNCQGLFGENRLLELEYALSRIK